VDPQNGGVEAKNGATTVEKHRNAIYDGGWAMLLEPKYQLSGCAKRFGTDPDPQIRSIFFFKIFLLVAFHIIRLLYLDYLRQF
jgi:hypothetical protein